MYVYCALFFQISNTLSITIIHAANQRFIHAGCKHVSTLKYNARAKV